MPDAPKPVTVLGDLRVSTNRESERGQSPFQSRPATVADLVSARRAEGAIVIEKVNGGWPEWLTDVDGPIWHQCGQTWGLLDDIFDGLAEAQP